MVETMSDTKENESHPRRVSTTITLIICSTLAFFAVLGAFVYLESVGKGTAAYMAFLAFAVGAIPGIVNYKQSREIKAQNEEIKVHSEEIKEQTNGPLTAKFNELQSKIQEIQHTQESYRSVMRQINPDEIPAQRQVEDNRGN